MKNTHVSRRTMLKGLAAIPVVAIVGYTAIASAAPVTSDDPTAKALEYTDKSTMTGKICSGCALYQGGSEAMGPCPLFPGKEVAAAGWCKSWVAKA